MTILKAGYDGYTRNWRRAYSKIYSAAFIIDPRYKDCRMPASLHRDGMEYWAKSMTDTEMGEFVECRELMRGGKGPFVGE